jgi:hypothetical protein
MWHENVCDDQIGQLGTRHCQRLGTIIGFKKTMTEIAKQGDIRSTVRWIGVNNEDGCHYV